MLRHAQHGALKSAGDLRIDPLCNALIAALAV
jgi:hypothetical protein